MRVGLRRSTESAPLFGPEDLTANGAKVAFRQTDVTVAGK